MKITEDKIGNINLELIRCKCDCIDCHCCGWCENCIDCNDRGYCICDCDKCKNHTF